MFQKAEIKRWRRAVHKEIDRLDALARGEFRAAAMVLIAVSGFGTEVTALCEITGQPEAFIRAVLKRLRRQRLLVGQTVRIRWDDPGFEGLVALALDALVATGEVDRPVDPKRSQALKGKAGRKPGTSARRTTLTPGAVFSPKRVKSNPWYQIAKPGR